jgi:hypothetical protein
MPFQRAQYPPTWPELAPGGERGSWVVRSAPTHTNGEGTMISVLILDGVTGTGKSQTLRAAVAPRLANLAAGRTGDPGRGDAR